MLSGRYRDFLAQIPFLRKFLVRVSSYFASRHYLYTSDGCHSSRTVLKGNRRTE